ncbi:MAG: SDR family oxidoreductase, partial [Janthinobacterium lividum]
MTTALQDKIAVITGGSSGIGLAIAKRFVAEGAFVFITGRNQDDLHKAVTEIGGDIVAIQADSSNLANLDHVFATIGTQKGRVHILVANAGNLEHAPIADVTEGHFDRLFSVNVKGLVFTVQKALPLMADGSAIILMSSTVAGKGLGGSGIYAATKAAIRSFARSWIVDLKERKIRVNVISPGPIDTPGLSGAAPNATALTAMMAAMASQVPLGRVGDPDEIAKTAV